MGRNDSPVGGLRRLGLAFTSGVMVVVFAIIRPASALCWRRVKEEHKREA